MRRRIFGGIHPPEYKNLSAGGVINPVSPRQVVIPMQQHIGAPCVPLVKVGEKVLLGQKIGDGEGLCAPVHASVSGIVRAVEPRPHGSGRPVMAVVIENDFRNAAIPAEPLIHPDGDTILHRIRDAGIVGMGGAAFPGSVKAMSAMGKVDTLIGNACECEPYITADDTLLRMQPEQVLRGLELLGRLLNPQRVVLAIEDNKSAAIARMREALPEFPGVELLVLPTRYPQGAEKQLIRSVTGREVPPGQLPAGVGCAVFNVSTLAAVSRAVMQGQPVTARIVTVTGAVREPQNLLVPIGTPLQDVLDAAGGCLEGAQRVVCGGPMMGIAQSDLTVPVVKATNCVLCLREVPQTVGAAVCIRCGKCLRACPMHLQPLYLHRFSGEKYAGELTRLHISDCVECGCCAYTCPGKLPLVESIRAGKRYWKEVSSL